VPERTTSADPLVEDLAVYEVGGAVRDDLLGRPVTDRDYVIVGALPETLEARGFKRVGRDFPVFLHPKTGAEYALARTERKTGAGHGGFVCFASPEVTLDEDLKRRDLTVNAMARAPDGTLIDPYGGVSDLHARMLRHVSPAFVEDPLRVLRVARFAAQLGFDVAPETRQVMREIADSGELTTLTAERVWTETRKGLESAHPDVYFDCLADVGALAPLFPELAGVRTRAPETWQRRLDGLTRGAHAGDELPVRAATVLAAPGGDGTVALADRMKLPRAIREVVHLAATHGQALLAALDAGPASLLELVKTADALRRPDRLHAALTAECRVADADPTPIARHIDGALAALADIDLAKVATETADPAAIPAAVEAARLAAMERYLEPGA